MTNEGTEGQDRKSYTDTQDRKSYTATQPMDATITGWGSEVRWMERDDRRIKRNEAILAERVALWNEKTEPRVGDYLQFPDGHFERFSHDWDDAMQTSPEGSFYFGNGYMSFSGGLNAAIDKTRFEATDEWREGSAWFFESDFARAHSAIYVSVPCRVFRLREK